MSRRPVKGGDIVKIGGSLCIIYEERGDLRNINMHNQVGAVKGKALLKDRRRLKITVDDIRDTLTRLEKQGVDIWEDV